MTVIVRLYCDVISCEVARRGVQRDASGPAAAAVSSACGRLGVVYRGRSDLDRRPRAFYLLYSVVAR